MGISGSVPVACYALAVRFVLIIAVVQFCSCPWPRHFRAEGFDGQRCLAGPLTKQGLIVQFCCWVLLGAIGNMLGVARRSDFRFPA